MPAEASWKEEILSTLAGAGSDVDVKALRKMILVARQLDEKDKAAKKTFKTSMKEMEREALLKVASDGKVTLLRQQQQQQQLTIKKKRKHKDAEDAGANNDSAKKTKTKDKKESKKAKNDKKKDRADEQDANDESAEEDNEDAVSNDDGVAVKNNNPNGVTRLFVGNLPFKVDETSLGEFLPGITHIKWITDMETGRFYGSAFVEMKNQRAAGAAVAKSGEVLLKRPVKVNFAPPRPGDAWPPAQTTITGNGPNNNNNGSTNDEATTKTKKKPAAGGIGISAMGEKPADCHKLFVGNLSYEIDDDAITKFFESVNAEVKAIRWIHHKDTGFFKGVGFIEFWNTEACGKAATLNGKSLLGRPIRIDWTD